MQHDFPKEKNGKETWTRLVSIVIGREMLVTFPPSHFRHRIEDKEMCQSNLMPIQILCRGPAIIGNYCLHLIINCNSWHSCWHFYNGPHPHPHPHLHPLAPAPTPTPTAPHTFGNPQTLITLLLMSLIDQSFRTLVK